MQGFAAPLVDARRVERVAAREAERAPAVFDRRSPIITLHGATRYRWVVGVALVHPIQVTELPVSCLCCLGVRSVLFEPHDDVGQPNRRPDVA